MVIKVDAAGRLGQSLASALDSKGMTLRDLATAVGSSYEHIRKLITNRAQPSKSMLRLICQATGLNYKVISVLVDRDRMEKKYGSAPQIAAGKDPRLSEYEAIVPHLTDEQNEIVLQMVRGLVKQNRGKGRA